jgi:hypothetical protein
MQRIRMGHYTFPPEYFAHISAEAKDLITRMLLLNDKNRITIAEVL